MATASLPKPTCPLWPLVLFAVLGPTRWCGRVNTNPAFPPALAFLMLESLLSLGRKIPVFPLSQSSLLAPQVPNLPTSAHFLLTPSPPICFSGSQVRNLSTATSSAFSHIHPVMKPAQSAPSPQGHPSSLSPPSLALPLVLWPCRVCECPGPETMSLLSPSFSSCYPSIHSSCHLLNALTADKRRWITCGSCPCGTEGLQEGAGRERHK